MSGEKKSTKSPPPEPKEHCKDEAKTEFAVNCSISTMICHTLFIFALSFLVINFTGTSRGAVTATEDSKTSLTTAPVETIVPSVSVSVLVRNKGFALPFFLNHLDKQNYPKNRMEVLMYYDDSIDNSYDILSTWVNKMSDHYHFINFYHDESLNSTDQEEYWTSAHFDHIMQLRQKMLDSSRDSWADFHFSIDADIILTEPDTLYDLVMASTRSTEEQPISIIAPLLDCTNAPSYANFWGDMTEQGYYKRSDDYFAVRQRRKQGILPVPMVHSVFLVNLKHLSTQKVGYWPLPLSYNGPKDDIIVFAKSAKAAGVQIYLDNRKKYGYFSSPVDQNDMNRIKLPSPLERRLARDKELFVHLKLQAMLDTENTLKIESDPDLESYVQEALPDKTLLGFDKIYVINLKRREDRLDRMVYCLNELGISWEYFEAVDGKKMTKQDIENYGIKQLPGYFDPYHNRSLKYGEIGCFLSHYKIWQEMVEKNLDRVLIFEDDIRFVSGFKRMATEVMQEIDHAIPNWDLLYYGRKRMSRTERKVENATTLAHPDYTYWTLAYCITKEGAKKLLDQRPLGKIVAVDEYIPIMFDRHPNKEWLKNFEPRNLIAISAEPLLVEPTHYTGEPNYFSDTEESSVIESQG